MRKLVFASLFTLAAILLLPQVSSTVRAGDFGANYEGGGQEAAVNIERVKTVLKLTPSQQRYWAPVEAALRSIARHQAEDANGGFVHRISHRVISIVLDSVAVKRLVVAARPLMRVLNDEQKQAAQSLAMEMGFGAVVAALN